MIMLNTWLKAKEECAGCTVCAHVCRRKCIVMKSDDEGFLYPNIDVSGCTKCGICIHSCPFRSDKKNSSHFLKPEAYAVKHKDDSVRVTSSSGGVFSAISDFILASNGIVAGAAFDNNFKVCHELAKTKDQSKRFKGAKYVQSILADIFIQVQELLAYDKNVLFSGTPCQIAGLYSFLGKDSEHLFTCDVICHGVASPAIFEDYMLFLKRKYNSKIISSVSFRNWNPTWRDSQGIRIVFDNFTYEKFKTEDIFYRLYLGRSFIIRPACHHCKYSSMPRVSDVTLGDFWGIERHHQEFADHNKGVSLVLLNTEKGKKLFENSKQTLNYMKSSIDKCMQPNLARPTIPHDKRKYFWSLYGFLGFPMASLYANYAIFKTKIQERLKIKK